MVADPVDVLALLADHHSLDVFVFHQEAELDEIGVVRSGGYRLTLNNQVVGHLVVGSMEQCLFEQLFSDFEFAAARCDLFRTIPRSFLHHRQQILLYLLNSIAC